MKGLLGILSLAAGLSVTAPADPVDLDGSWLAAIASAECETHESEMLIYADAGTHSGDGSAIVAATPVATAVTCGSCCPTYDPRYDCWADGHWHYNHCKEAEGCGVN